MAVKKISIAALFSRLQEVHPDLREISAGDVVVANWVRLKCRYGCQAYGRHLGCPPYSPTPEETQRVLEGVQSRGDSEV